MSALVLPSSCGIDELALSSVDLAPGRSSLSLASGWGRRWTTSWKRNGSEVTTAVRELESLPLVGWEPSRRFSWRTGQRHRPGLQYLVSTDRHHGFESIAEQRLLLALDFAGQVQQVLSQPFGLRYEAESRWRRHVPDFLAVTATGVLVVDVRPGDRIGDADRVAFAATAEAALAAGWRYVVVTGWRAQVMSNLDTLSAQRRRLADPTGVQREVLAVAAHGPVAFGDLVAAAAVPALARAHALHLIWHRRLVIDLGVPLRDLSTVWTSTAGGAS